MKFAASLVCFLLLSGVDVMASNLKIVTFGTSLTARGGWQMSLENTLEECLHRPVDIAVVAKSGSTTEWALSAVDSVIAERPEIVLVEFYANDAALNRWMSVDVSKRNFSAVVERLRMKLPDARIFMMVMNPMSGLRGAIRPFLYRYIAAHRRVAAEWNVEIVDHSAGWAKLSAEELSAAIPDGVHPTGSMAARIMVPTIAKAIAGTCVE
ncbi:SGNH/GDSL hydrolase family protein [Rhizobium mesosinicum]|uniref:SGNH/GDSL hydrolase family protein n=1 Tax=Rhizobium mesosinicum TaxID=335017 RepID=A0ABS7H288_9HYPH|nr:SGNH/GDSL hydrolase family protein [Rhizobium mesosinicum]MBW9055977.1 SGNH/GDSL hydrolase family protein [Rhizobium mesosinicum]